MSNTVTFGYGALCDTLEEQANAQGFTLGAEAERLEKIREAITWVKFHVATDKQVESMRNKLHKQVIKALRPMDREKEEA